MAARHASQSLLASMRQSIN